jgi:toxin ParE1/3/4
MMHIVWSELAEHDLHAIHAHIARENLRAAFRVVHTIHHVTRIHLTTAPLSGRQGRIVDTRELVIPHLPYIVAYRIHKDSIQILRVLHTSIRWPENP